MADITHTHGKRVSTPAKPVHPMDPYTVEEYARLREILEAAGELTAATRFPSVLPVEPDHAELDAFRPGDALDRRLLVTLLETDTGLSRELVVSVTNRKVLSSTPLQTESAPYGQPPYLFEEYERVEAIVKASPAWQEGMRRRGIAESAWALAFCAPLAPGAFGVEGEVGNRVIRSLTFLRDHEDDSPWAHPVEGLVVTINLTTSTVVSVVDEGDAPTHTGSGNYSADAVGPARTSLKPIDIRQPEGPSFTVDGSHVSWEGWDFRVGFNAREGLVLGEVGFTQGEERRSILRRASVPEMVVPYGDNSPNRYWISYFDAGEYLLGKNANPLSLGCDCLGVIHYFDGVVAGDDGGPVTIPQVICMHEEDYGILWKHTEFGQQPDVRRSRRLVVSYFATVGNYDYGFFWYFYLDGTIQVEAKATGIVFNGSGVPGSDNPHAGEIAPGLFAPVHQHLFCARLDVAIDGPRNVVEEVDVVGIPTGPDNPRGNAFTWERTRLRTEKEAQRLADNLRGRTWHVSSTERTNAVGKPTGYQLVPEGTPVLLAQPDSSVGQRATFASKHLWATAYERDELWPGGMYPNQHEGGAGLPAYSAGDASVDGEEIVLWHVFGPTHIPRPEDWPIMPVDYSGFTFKPYGFFDRNPALDLPDGATPAASSEGDSCCSTDA